jgi:hypothetical protein
MKTLKQPATTSMPTKIKNHLSKGRSRSIRSVRAQSESSQASAGSQRRSRFTSLNPAKIEQLIGDLSDLRMLLAPDVSPSILRDQRLFVTPEPIWDVSAEVRADGRVLLFRHPGIGWLGFILPQADCDRLAKKLTGGARGRD